MIKSKLRDLYKKALGFGLKIQLFVLLLIHQFHYHSQIYAMGTYLPKYGMQGNLASSNCIRSLSLNMYKNAQYCKP